MESSNNYYKDTLDSGLRVLTIPMPSTRSVTVMVMAGAGSRYEQRRINGLSHFIEHMFFKGGEKYPDTMAVSSAIDSVGGAFNAFTSEEKVAYFVKLSSSKKEIAYDVLSDMLLKSKFDSEEIERERGVIIEEIRMYNDDPMSRVQMDFKTHFFGDQPLGWDIAGPEEVIQSVVRDDFMEFRSSHYIPENCTLVAAGGLTHEENMELAKTNFAFEKGNGKIEAAPYQPLEGARSLLSKREIEQAHFIIGFPIPGDGHDDQPALKVMTNIFGGTMSSRLFHQVRERRGLAYYIRASRHAFSDTGCLQITSGVNVDKLEDAIGCVMEEVNKISTNGITEEELQRGKENLKGRIDLSLEDSMNVASMYAMQETLFKKVKTPEELVKEIDAVTLDHVADVANRYLDKSKVRMAALGPYDALEPFDRRLDS